MNPYCINGEIIHPNSRAAKIIRYLMQHQGAVSISELAKACDSMGLLRVCKICERHPGITQVGSLKKRNHHKSGRGLLLYEWTEYNPYSILARYVSWCEANGIHQCNQNTKAIALKILSAYRPDAIRSESIDILHSGLLSDHQYISHYPMDIRRTIKYLKQFLTEEQK